MAKLCVEEEELGRYFPTSRASPYFHDNVGIKSETAGRVHNRTLSLINVDFGSHIYLHRLTNSNCCFGLSSHLLDALSAPGVVPVSSLSSVVGHADTMTLVAGSLGTMFSRQKGASESAPSQFRLVWKRPSAALGESVVRRSKQKNQP